MTPRQFGPYELLEIIGVGGMGEVWRARDHRRQRLVALKLLPQSLGQDQDFLNRFRRESNVAARLREPHVVPIHDYGEIDGQLYIDMRLVDGRDLGNMLKEGPLAPDRSIALLGQVADALEAAHADGLVHRDVKPSNILVTPNDFVYVVDFGIARSIGSTRSSLTLTGATVGTLDYMAPERFANAPLDGRVDVYSLACVLAECLTARPPFAGDSLATLLYAHLYAQPPRPSELTPGVPRELDTVVARGMAKQPEDRYATPADLMRAARAALHPAAARSVTQPAGFGEISDEGAAPGAQGRQPETTVGPAGRGVLTGPPEGNGSAPAQPDQRSQPAWPAPPAVGLRSTESGHSSVQPLPAPPPWSERAEPAWPEQAPPSWSERAEPGWPEQAPPSWLESRGPAGPGGPLPPSPPAGRAGARRARWWLVAAALAVILVGGVLAVLLWPDGDGGGSTAAGPGSEATSGETGGAEGSGGSPEPSAVPAPEPATSVAVPSVEGEPIPVNATPGFIAVEPSGRQGYIANREEGIVTVLDTTLDRVTGTIPIEAGPPTFITFSPNGRQAYVTVTNAPDYTENFVVFVDTRTNRVTATVEVGLRPFAPQTSPDGRLLYVPLHDEDRVEVLDTETAREVDSIDVAPNPHWITVSPDGRTAYTANHDSNLVSAIDLASLEVVAEIPTGVSPHSLSFSPDGKQVSVVNFDSNDVSIIDVATNTVAATIDVGQNPQDLTYAPDGRHLYTADVDSGTVTVLDTETRTVTASLPLGTSPTSVAVTPDGTKAYVTDLDSGTVRVLRIGDR